MSDPPLIILSNPLFEERTGNILEKVTPVYIRNPIFDAGYRMRTSSLKTVLDAKTLKSKNPHVWSEAGTGTSTFNTNEKHVEMSVTSGQYLIRKTKSYAYYLSGKSQLVEITTSRFEPQSGIEKRIGYFDTSFTPPFNTSYDGIAIEAKNNTHYLTIYKNGSALYEIPRSMWSDPLDGTGASRETIDFSKFNVFAFDFLWLGGTRVKFFVVLGGEIHEFHRINNAGIGSGIMMRSPYKPITYEIRSTGGSGVLNSICTQVSSEGSLDEIGIPTALSTGSISITSVGVYYALLGFRLKSTHFDIPVLLEEISVLSTTNDNYIFDIRLNPVIAGSFTFGSTTEADSAIEYSIGAGNANTVTGGKSIYQKTVQQSYGTVINPNNTLRIGCNIDGTMDRLVMCVSPLSSNMSINGSANLKEML